MNSLKEILLLKKKNFLDFLQLNFFEFDMFFFNFFRKYSRSNILGAKKSLC